MPFHCFTRDIVTGTNNKHIHAFSINGEQTPLTSPGFAVQEQLEYKGLRLSFSSQRNEEIILSN